MTALDDSYLDEPRELDGCCERCGDRALTTLSDDGELCAPCTGELDDELEAQALCAAGDGVEAESSEQLREAAE